MEPYCGTGQALPGKPRGSYLTRQFRAAPPTGGIPRPFRPNSQPTASSFTEACACDDGPFSRAWQFGHRGGAVWRKRIHRVRDRQRVSRGGQQKGRGGPQPAPAYFHHKDAEQAMTRTTDRAFLLGTRSSIAPTGCKPCFEVNKAKPEYNSNSPEAFSLVFWGSLWGILGAFGNSKTPFLKSTSLSGH
jgi:hypothetical protein